MNSAAPSTTPPLAITTRGPTRSTSHPSTGPDTPCPTTSRENAPATTERLQPNSRRKATKKTEYEYQNPYASPSVTKVATSTRHSAPLAVRSVNGLATAALRAAWRQTPAPTTLPPAELRHHALGEQA